MTSREKKIIRIGVRIGESTGFDPDTLAHSLLQLWIGDKVPVIDTVVERYDATRDGERMGHRPDRYDVSVTRGQIPERVVAE